LSEDRLIEKEIGKLINLCHPCIAGSIGFVFVSGSRELKIFRLSSGSETLKEVIETSPAWWTPTAKAKAVAGIVLGLRFAHSLGLIHDHLTTKNIIFDLNHRIEITEFLSCSSGNEMSGFSREGWNPKMDVCGFVSILFEIVVGHPLKDEAEIPSDVPTFVCEMIKSGLSGERRRLSSFQGIFETLTQNNFAIVSGIHSAEVWSYVGWIEEVERFRE
jgi:serine/threonine protein kinase